MILTKMPKDVIIIKPKGKKIIWRNYSYENE